MSWLLLWGEDRGEARGHVECKGMLSTLLLLPMVVFAPALQKWQLGVLGFFFFFGHFLSFVQNLPQLHTHTHSYF